MAVNRIPVVTHVAFVLRLEGLELDRRLRVAELIEAHGGGERSRSPSGRVAKLDVALDELGEPMRFTRATLPLIVLLIVVAPAAPVTLFPVFVLGSPGLVHIRERKIDLAVEAPGTKSRT